MKTSAEYRRNAPLPVAAHGKAIIVLGEQGSGKTLNAREVLSGFKREDILYASLVEVQVGLNGNNPLCQGKRALIIDIQDFTEDTAQWLKPLVTGGSAEVEGEFVALPTLVLCVTNLRVNEESLLRRYDILRTYR